MLKITYFIIFVSTLLYIFYAPAPMDKLEDLTVSRKHLYFQEMDKERTITDDSIELPIDAEVTVEERKENIQQLAILGLLQ